MEELQEAFANLKVHLPRPPSSLPSSESPLLLYITVIKGTVSAILIEEHRRTRRPEQSLVYYVS